MFKTSRKSMINYWNEHMTPLVNEDNVVVDILLSMDTSDLYKCKQHIRGVVGSKYRDTYRFYSQPLIWENYKEIRYSLLRVMIYKFLMNNNLDEKLIYHYIEKYPTSFYETPNEDLYQKIVIGYNK